MRQARPLAQALHSMLDFALNRTLQPATLARLGAQTVSLMADDECKGSHCLHFFGDGEFSSSATFDGQELAAFLDDLRGAMRKAAWGKEAPYTETDVYRYEGPRNEARLTSDLVRFAKRGYQFYAAIISRLAGGYGQFRDLADLMALPGTVQIASKARPRFLLPVAMIYDYGLDTNAPAGEYRLCPDFGQALKDGAPLEESSCFQGNCSSRGSATTVCPSGFWGYRHNLGLPLSTDSGPEMPPEIVYSRAPELAVAVSTDERFQLRDEHVPRIRALNPDLGWHYADRRDTTLKMLKEADPHLVYLYCHGGMSGPVPFIQVGPRNERGITPDNLLFNGIYWPTRPLVFINGCHTTALTPDVPLEFVSIFLEMSEASAVIGTEITIFEPLAVSFAESFLPRFLAGAPLGEAVRGARLALLEEGNPLGLVYIPYALAGLRLVQAPDGA
jgi:hypothetical protein